MSSTNHYTIAVGDIIVSIDELNGHVGIGYRIGDRSYTAAGFASVAAAQRAATEHVRRSIRARGEAREANARRMKDFRTIRSR